MLLEAKNITKRFPGVLALDKVNLEIREGEIVALVGQNGAGKSTLSNIIYGAINADEGNVIYKGQEITNIIDPIVAQSLGISVMFQESVLIPQLSIAENIYLCNEFKKGLLPMVDFKKQYFKSNNILNSLELDFDVKLKVSKLKSGQRRLVEIARAVGNEKTSLLIMDEPTSAIDKKDKENLFKVLRRLKKLGISTLFISHYLDEVFEIADRINVLRDGKNAGDLIVDETLEVDQIITLMTGGIGRDMNRIESYSNVRKNEIVLEVRGLKKHGMFNDISFSLHKGEVLGIAGLVEAGQKEIVMSIYGTSSFDEGDIYVRGKKKKIKSPLEAIKNGIGFISEDRIGECLLPNMNVRENMSLQILDSLNKFASFIDRKKENEIVNRYIEELDIATSSMENKFINLSGGNKQKAIVARLLMSNSTVLIINEPTHGIDVKAKVELHEKILDIAHMGLSLLLVTSELDELCNLCHRILIIHDGEIVKELISEETKQNIVLGYINGAIKE